MGKSVCSTLTLKNRFKLADLLIVYLHTGGSMKVLGGLQDYCQSPQLQNKMETHPPRLFACSNKTGNFLVCLSGHVTVLRISRVVFI